jgi:uncharacterized protein YprB with RNaseH-like and TPR domain
MIAYIDIETSLTGEITVFGIYYENGKIKQLVGKEITKEKILDLLKDIKYIYTYNGSKFDLPKIRKELDLDLEMLFVCHDLMYYCWNKGLYGGLKSVEKQLGIPRKLDMNGNDAMALWEQYQLTGDKYVLELLLEYNKEDVVNLAKLRKKLET